MNLCSSEGAYVVVAVDYECGVNQDVFHDFDRAHDPKLASKLSSIGVMLFWFDWYHPYSLDILCYIV